MVKVEGAISIAVCTAGKKAGLLKLGADHVIVTDEEELVARVHEITSGKGARIVFDPIGGRILEALAAATAPKGIIFEYGALAPEPTPYPLFTALAKYLTIRAYTVFELTPDPVLPKAKQYVFDHLAWGHSSPSSIGRSPSRRSSKPTAIWSRTLKSVRSSSSSDVEAITSTGGNASVTRSPL